MSSVVAKLVCMLRGHDPARHIHNLSKRYCRRCWSELGSA